MNEQKTQLNGFAVSSLVLGILCFAGSFQFWLVRSLAADHPIHMWFRMLMPSGPLLNLLALVLAIAGIITCRRHSSYTGSSAAVIGLVLGALATLHWLGIILLFSLGRGYA